MIMINSGEQFTQAGKCINKLEDKSLEEEEVSGSLNELDRKHGEARESNQPPIQRLIRNTSLDKSLGYIMKFKKTLFLIVWILIIVLWFWSLISHPNSKTVVENKTVSTVHLMLNNLLQFQAYLQPIEEIVNKTSIFNESSP